jgi:hypothetical protein
MQANRTRCLWVSKNWHFPTLQNGAKWTIAEPDTEIKRDGGLLADQQCSFRQQRHRTPIAIDDVDVVWHPPARGSRRLVRLGKQARERNRSGVGSSERTT